MLLQCKRANFNTIRVWGGGYYPEDWFYADMQEATNSHDYTWVTVSGDKVEKWTEKLEQRDWAALEHAWSTAHSAPGGEVTK